MAAGKIDLQSVEAEYASALEELTFEHKTVIESLTTIAQETVDGAVAIVSAIEDRIRLAPINQKLPALYLMDSICKFAKPDNVRQVYIASFTRNIVKVFGHAFQMVTDDVKLRMEKLMETWKNLNVFPTHIIRSLESFVRQWKAPMGPPPASSYPYPVSQPSFQAQQPTPPSSLASTLMMLSQQVQALITAKQTRQTLFPGEFANNQQLGGLQQLQQLIASGTLAKTEQQATLNQVMNHVQQMYSQTFPPTVPMFAPSSHQLAAEQNRLSPRLPQSLLEDAGNVLNQMRGNTTPPVHVSAAEIGRSTASLVGRISLTTEDINRRRPGAFQTLYEALPQQCRQCGFRFPPGEEGQQKMGVHMDFHFRQNRRVMDKAKKMVSRDWYVSVDDWIANREAKVSDDASPFFGVDALKPEAAKKKGTPMEIPNVKAPEGGDAVGLKCPICHEKFVKFWDEDSEEWMLKDAIMFEGKLRHFTCNQELSNKNARPKSPDPGIKRTNSPAVPSVLGKRSSADSPLGPDAKRSPLGPDAKRAHSG